MGFEMPNVTVTRLDSSAIDLTALRGKPVVINWWHTACSPCIAEMPELNELVESRASTCHAERSEASQTTSTVVY